EETTTYLIRRQLLGEHYLKLDDLSEELYVSRSTVHNDLKNGKEILNEYGIQLETRPNYGIKLKGSELKLRADMSEDILTRWHVSELKVVITFLYFKLSYKKLRSKRNIK